MKIGRWGWLAMAIAPLMSGCSGFWNAPASSSTTTTTTLSSGYFFLMDAATDSIVSYYIDAGTLTLVSTTTLAASPLALTVAPNGDFLFVSTTGGIYVYTISSGVLTEGNSDSDITYDQATAMSVDSSDSWLVESSASGMLNAIPINSSTGAFDNSRSAQNVALSANAVNQIAFSANNAFVFVASGSSGTYEYAFNRSSSSTPLGTSAANTISLVGSAALAVAVDPADRLVYVTETAAVSSSGGLRAFTLNTSSGALSEISGSPLSSGGTGPYAILPKSTEDYVYVANWAGTSTGNITGFSITATSSSYALTKLSSSVSTGIRPMALAEDSNKDFVLAASAGGGPYFDAYIFDTTTAGQLDNVVTSSAYAASAVAALP
jgi:6-phosphogluconolactonase (cycloisomerase 2 family)